MEDIRLVYGCAEGWILWRTWAWQVLVLNLIRLLAQQSVGRKVITGEIVEKKGIQFKMLEEVYTKSIEQERAIH